MYALSFKPQGTVIVSPSMSGSFSIPFLNKHPNLLKGYVPVAPVGADLLKSPPSKACGEPPKKVKAKTNIFFNFRTNFIVY